MINFYYEYFAIFTGISRKTIQKPDKNDFWICRNLVKISTFLGVICYCNRTLFNKIPSIRSIVEHYHGNDRICITINFGISEDTRRYEQNFTKNVTWLHQVFIQRFRQHPWNTTLCMHVKSSLGSTFTGPSLKKFI